MNVTVAVVLTHKCGRCGKDFEIKQHRVKQGRGTYCSNDCRRKPLPAAVPFVAVIEPPAVKFHRVSVKKTPGQTSITPKAIDRLPMIEGGSHLNCARCGLLRERGQRCSCERWAPDGEVAS